MRPRYKHLLRHSVQFALAAIEIYNKPHFNSREQVFSILIVSAWESLLKARILQTSKNKLSRIYVKKSARRYKTNRHNHPLTIDIYEAMRRLSIPDAVSANVGHLVEIRDAAIHLTAESPSLPHLVFMLGSAALRNYAALCSEWFKKSLADYNFYVMPVAFSAPCQTLELLNTNLDAEEIAAILDSAKVSQAAIEPSSPYDFVCQVKAELVSIKKTDLAPSVVAAISPDGVDATIFQKPVHALDRYPLAAKQAAKKVREAVTWATHKDIWDAIKTLKIKGDARYSKYSYPTKAAELAGPRKSVGVIYNDDAVRLLIDFLKKRGDTPSSILK